MTALRTVRLYGHLGARFGREHRFHVRTAGEAVRACIANFPGFAQAVLAGAPGYRIWHGTEQLGERDLERPGAGVIRIVPVIAGAKDGKGIGQLILGAALIALPFAAPGLAAVSFAGTTVGAVATSIGISLALGGISSLLFAPPKPGGPAERPESRASAIFDGPVNTTAQGHPVPVGYGRLRVGSQVISAGLTVEVLPP
ncbi:MAG: tail assembly protein [Gammaproteobacteria bacterium]|nr:tail assembly protein [Gammaproteobacteria bacterium]